MIPKITLEAIDLQLRTLVKRITLGGRVSFNRQIAVTNQLFYYEKIRGNNEKECFPQPIFQTHHVFYNKVSGWDYSELEQARSHADVHKRIFLPFLQMGLEYWEILELDQADINFNNMANRGLQFVPYNIPYGITIDIWKKKKEELLKILLPSQFLVPIISSRHDDATFQAIIDAEYGCSKFIGIHLYNFTQPIEKINLLYLKKASLEFTEKEKHTFIIGFNPSRRLEKISNVSSAFFYSLYGIDVLSPKQISHAQLKAMLRNKAEDDEISWFYDKTQGGYSTNPDQKAWHEVGLVDLLLENITLSEALNKYQAIVWFGTQIEQQDLNELNHKMLEPTESPLTIVGEKSKWYVSLEQVE